jgi:hypothetical protein
LNSFSTEAQITGRIGLGPQSFNEFSLSAFAQEFKINFGDNILFAFSSNDLKPYATLSAASVGGGAQFIDVAVPQPFVSYAISATDMLHYGIYLKHLSAEEWYQSFDFQFLKLFSIHSITKFWTQFQCNRLL